MGSLLVVDDLAKEGEELVLSGGCIVFEIVLDTVVDREEVTAVTVVPAAVVTMLEDFDSTAASAVVTVVAVGNGGFSVLIVPGHLKHFLP